MPHQTFFFYDLETSGLNPREDRIMQFAGQRTSLVFEPLGEPINFLVKMSDDTLPSPGAIMVTGITPQATLADGISEVELARFLADEVFTPGTIAVGYNNVRFDDEFIRCLFWRNFYDAYEWHWRDGRSRWDLLDVVRMVRALRPEGITWPVDADGKATNRLEILTKANGLKHQHAHDALSDVEATIQAAELLQSRQPQIFDFLLNLRDKREVLRLLDPQKRQPVVWTAGQISSLFAKTTVALPLAQNSRGDVLLFDLRYNLDELLVAEAEHQTSETLTVVDCTGAEVTPELRELAQDHPAYMLDPKFPDGSPRSRFYPVLSQINPGRCPALAPLGVLEKDDAWQRIYLSLEQVKHNLQTLSNHGDVVRQLIADWKKCTENKKPPANADAESALYAGFVSDQDAKACGLVRGANARQLVGLDPQFTDPRLKELYLHYRARNYPQTLNVAEAENWEKYRTARLSRQAPSFLREIGRLQKQLATQPDDNKAFLVEELLLWYQSLGSADLEGQE